MTATECIQLSDRQILRWQKSEEEILKRPVTQMSRVRVHQMKFRMYESVSFYSADDSPEGGGARYGSRSEKAAIPHQLWNRFSPQKRILNLEGLVDP